jgi:hypothetical protein
VLSSEAALFRVRLGSERLRESRMREIRTSGSTRGEDVGLSPRFPFYSTDNKRRDVCATHLVVITWKHNVTLLTLDNCVRFLVG